MTIYHDLKINVETYFVTLVGFDERVQKGSFRIYYKDTYRKRLKFLEKALKDRGFKIYKVGKERSERLLNMFSRRVYFMGGHEK